MFNLDQETDTIDFRYYGLRATHTGINKNVFSFIKFSTDLQQDKTIIGSKESTKSQEL